MAIDDYCPAEWIWKIYELGAAHLYKPRSNCQKNLYNTHHHREVVIPISVTSVLYDKTRIWLYVLLDQIVGEGHGQLSICSLHLNTLLVYHHQRSLRHHLLLHAVIRLQVLARTSQMLSPHRC